MGTPNYMAPELFQDGAVHSFASDIWAFGCVLYEMASGETPFATMSFQDLVRSILEAEPAEIIGQLPSIPLRPKWPILRHFFSPICAYVCFLS